MAGNPWLQHLKSFWSKNKGKMSYRQAMVAAKKNYTPKSKASKGSKASKAEAPKKRRRRKKKKAQ